jgi:hypothetical protein
LVATVAGCKVSVANLDAGSPITAETYNPTEAGSRDDGARCGALTAFPQRVVESVAQPGRQRAHDLAPEDIGRGEDADQRRGGPPRQQEKCDDHRRAGEIQDRRDEVDGNDSGVRRNKGNVRVQEKLAYESSGGKVKPTASR